MQAGRRDESLRQPQPEGETVISHGKQLRRVIDDLVRAVRNEPGVHDGTRAKLWESTDVGVHWQALQ